MHRGGKWDIAKIDRRTLNDASRTVDDETQTSVLVEEGQSMASRVRTNATLAQTRDFPVAH